MRALLTLTIVSIALCAPTLAQEKGANGEAKQKVENVLAKVREAFVRNDAAAYARLFTSNAVFVDPSGKTFRGREEIERAAASFLQHVGAVQSFEDTVEEARALSDGTVWAIGHATINGSKETVKDHWAAVNVPQGSTLAVRMLSVGADLPPQPQEARTPAATSGSSRK